MQPKLKKLLTKKCKICNKPFNAKGIMHLYCSDECLKEVKKRVEHSAKYLAVRKLYRSSEKFKKLTQKHQKEYRQTEKFKKSQKISQEKYLRTERGRIKLLWNTVRLRIKRYLRDTNIKIQRKKMSNLLGCSPIFLKVYIENQFYNHSVSNKKMSWLNSKEWHIDHITPLSKLDPYNEEYFKIGNHFCNLQPMWQEENLKKSSKIMPGLGIANLKRKYRISQSFGDLTKIMKEDETFKIVSDILKKIK